MAENHICPLRATNPNINFLLCKKLMHEGIDYNKAENAVLVYCKHQEYCNCKGGYQNTASAAECNIYLTHKG